MRKDSVAQHPMVLQPNGTKLMYVDLKAVTDDYKQPSEVVAFEYLCRTICSKKYRKLKKWVVVGYICNLTSELNEKKFDLVRACLNPCAN